MSSNFWANKLAPLAQPQQLVVAKPSLPWWMGPTSPQQFVPADVAHNTPQGNEYSTTKAQSARLSDTCPGCSSGNYFAAPGRTLMRCYDCGYPVVQHFTGAGVQSGMGADVSGAARQLPANHVMTQIENGRGSLESGNHSVITSASQAVAHA